MDNYFRQFLGEAPQRDGRPYPLLKGTQTTPDFSDAFRQGANVFQQQLMQSRLGPTFGPAEELLKFATGQGITVGDESGTATISPGGGFRLAGKYNEFTVNPFMRQVGANFINPDGNFSVGGSIGMGPEGSYDPRAELNFQLGGFNQRPVEQQMQMPQETINPLSGDRIIVDEQGYTKRVPYVSRQDVMPSPYRGPYAR